MPSNVPHGVTNVVGLCLQTPLSGVTSVRIVETAQFSLGGFAQDFSQDEKVFKGIKLYEASIEDLYYKCKIQHFLSRETRGCSKALRTHSSLPVSF